MVVEKTAWPMFMPYTRPSDSGLVVVVVVVGGLETFRGWQTDQVEAEQEVAVRKGVERQRVLQGHILIQKGQVQAQEVVLH